MVKIGDGEIKTLYIGNSKIKKAYIEDNLIFGETKPSRLPEGYTEVEYIHMSGAVGFNTGYRITPSKIRALFDIEMEEESPAGLGHLLALYGNASGAKYLYLIRQSDTVFRIMLGWSSGTYEDFSVENVAGKRIIIDLNAPLRKIKIGDFSGNTGYPSTLEFSSGSLYIGSRLIGVKCPTSKLYSCKIYESSRLKFDFVPCTNISGVPGLFDLVGSKFYANPFNGVGTVTAGPPTV